MRHRVLNTFVSFIVTASMVMSLIPLEALADEVQRLESSSQISEVTQIDEEAAPVSKDEAPSSTASPQENTDAAKEPTPKEPATLENAAGKDPAPDKTTTKGPASDDATAKDPVTSDDAAAETPNQPLEWDLAAGDMQIVVKAQSDAIPQGTSFFIGEVTTEQREVMDTCMAMAREYDEPSIASSYTLALAAADADGNEASLPEGSTVEVSLTCDEAKDADLIANVYQLKKREAGQEGQQQEDQPPYVVTKLDAATNAEAGTITTNIAVPANVVLEFVRKNAPPAQEPEDTTAPGDEQDAQAGQPEQAAPSPAPQSDSQPADDQASDAAASTDKNRTEPQATDATSKTATLEKDTGTTSAANASARTEVSALSATQNIVGEVFANAINKKLSQGEDAAAESSAELEGYPTEHHDESYYADSLRLRKVYSAGGIDLGYLVYRDTFYMVSQEDATNYNVTFSEDKDFAYVSPAIDPAKLADKTGIVFLHENLGSDVVLVFAEGQKPTLDGNTLVVPIANAADLDLRQLFSDGVIEHSYSTDGQSTSMLQSRIASVSNVLGSRSSAVQTTSLQSALEEESFVTIQSADFKPTLSPPSGTNWKVTGFSNIDFDTPKVNYSLSITDFEFALIVTLGGSFDFKAESTGATGSRERKTIAGLNVGLDLFSLDFDLLFEAEFDNTPVKMEGRMGVSMDMYSDVLTGVTIRNFKTPITLKKFELANPSRDKNKDVRCYLGSGFQIDKSFLSFDIDWLDVHIGPLIKLGSLATGGTNFTARLEKDAYDPRTFDRTSDSVHSCAANGSQGCYTIRTQAISDYDYSLSADFYFKKYSHPFQHYHNVLDTHDYYNSIQHGSGLQEGHCPHYLHRVPVYVVAKDGNTERNVPNMAVSPVMDVDMYDVSEADYQQYTNATTGNDGRASLYLPYAQNTRYTLVASGNYGGLPAAGGAEQPSDMRTGLNDEVKIYLDATEKVLVRAKAVWDVDLEGNEVAPFTVVVQMRNESTNGWKNVGWCKLTGEATRMQALSDHGDAEAWMWSHEWPKYSLVNNKYVLNQFRVLQLRGDVSNMSVVQAGASYADLTLAPQRDAYYLNLDTGEWHYIRASAYGGVGTDHVGYIADEQAINSAISERAILPETSNPYVDYQVEEYTDSRGTHISLHRGNYKQSYSTSSEQDTNVDIQTTTITNMAIMDVDMRKVWKGVASSAQRAVYLALEQRPYDEWSSYAQELGNPTEWVTVLEPVDGASTTLRDLLHSDVVSWINAPSISGVPLGIALVSAESGWSTNIKVKRFRDGIPMRFRATELDGDVLRRLFNYEYASDQEVNVKQQWSGHSQPGEVYYDRYNAKASASVSNTSEDAAHTIGGTIFWTTLRDISAGTLQTPEYVTITVRNESGQEVGSVRVNRSDFPSATDGSPANSWTWSLTGTNIDSSKTYTISEQLGPVTHNGYWYPEINGLDVYNHFTFDNSVGISIEAQIDAPSGNVPSNTPLKIRLLDENGSQIGSNGQATTEPFELQYDASTGAYQTKVVYDAKRDNSPFAPSHDVNRFSIVATNPGVCTSNSAYANKVIPVYTKSTSYDSASFQFGHKFRVEIPTVTFHVRLVVQESVRPEIEVKWTAADGSPATAPTSNVYANLYRDGSLVDKYSVTASEGWKKTVTGDANTLPHITNDGHIHNYTVEPAPQDGYSSAVTVADRNTLSPKFTITYTSLGDKGVNVKGTVMWNGDNGKENLRPSTNDNKVRVTIVAQNGNDAHTARTVRTVDVPVPRSGSPASQAFEAKDLPRYDPLGQEITYSVLQDSAYGYTTTYGTPVFDATTRTWTCNVTNTLTGHFALNIKKVIQGTTDADETYSFLLYKVSTQGSEDTSNTPDPLSSVVHITGASTAQAEFLIGEDGMYLYRVEEVAGSNANCTYDTPKTVLITRSTDAQGSTTFASFVLDGETSDSPFFTPKPYGGEQAVGLDKLAGKKTDTATFTNSYRSTTIEVKKTWDIDLEKKDRPASIQALVQRKSNDTWENVKLVELTANNDWKATVSLSGGSDGITYRVRELKESVGATSPENLTDAMILAEAQQRIVYDSKDSDKPKDADGKDLPANEVTYHVNAYESALGGGTVDAHTTKYQVSYKSEEDGDKKTFTITNKAILQIDVIKRWIAPGVDEDDMPDSAWVVLMCKPKAGALDSASSLASAAGVDISGVLNYEFPVINPIKGGNDPVSIITKLTLGVDLGFLGDLDIIPKLAIGRVTKDNNWTYSVVLSKYNAGIPMEYKGAELGSEVIRQIIKYLTKGTVDLPVSYNPFGQYISIPTKAIKTPLGLTDFDLSQLKDKALEKAQSLTIDDIQNFGPNTLLTDYHLMANVINVKVDFDPDNPDPENSNNTVQGIKTWDDNNDELGNRPEAITVRLLANGVEVDSQETSAVAGWKYFFLNRPDKDDNGNKITYTVEEVAVPGYTATVDGYNITNKTSTVSVCAKSTWDDDNDRDGKRPKEVTLRLLQNGTEIQAKTVAAGDNWQWEFDKLPAYIDGQQASYTVTQDEVDAYTTTTSGDSTRSFVFANKHTPQKTSVKVTKTWNDADDQDGKRPSSVTVVLYANGKVSKRQSVTADDGWTWTFADLYKYEGGKEVTYTVGEETVDDYTNKVTGSAADGFTITNAHTPQKTLVKVSKSWDDANDQDGKRPSSVTVIVKGDGNEVARRAITAADGWAWTFTNLDKYKGGSRIAYTVDEVAVDGYAKKVTGNAANGFAITNTHKPETSLLTVSKVWDDANNQDGKRPSSVTVVLKADGQEKERHELTAADGWQWTIEGLPKYADGHQIAYSVSEEQVEGYTAKVAGDAASGFTITNTHTPETTSVAATKEWDDADNQDGKRPESVTVILKANGQEAQRKTVSQSSEWQCAFEDVPVYRNGVRITYTVDEVAVDGYTKQIAGNASDGFTITNTHTPERTSVVVTKAWNDANDQDGKRPSSVAVILKANGEETDRHNVTATSEWTWRFTNLNKYQDGKEVAYTVDEEDVDGYTKNVAGSAADGFTITNTHIPERTSVTATKVWDDADNQDGKRPDSVTLILKANGQESKRKNITADDDEWQYTFENLPKYQAGDQITYTVEEVSVKDYTTTVSGSIEDGFVVTNKHVPETVTVRVQKKWDDADNQDGMRPPTVTLEVYADGNTQAPVATSTHRSDADFSTSYVLPKYQAGQVGQRIAYTVGEEVVEDYTSEVTGTVADGFIITNTHTPQTLDIPVTKVWDDADDQDGMRPDSVGVYLYANGRSVAGTMLTAKGSWYGAFSNRPKYRNGQEIDYTVTESAVDGYTSEVTGNADKGFTITNMHTPQQTSVTVTKAWNDNANQDGKRPESVTVHLYADGTNTNTTLTLSSDDGWRGTFCELDKYRDGGQEIAYTVDEEDVDDYSKAIGGTAADGFTITNTHGPEQVTIFGTKVWDDNNNQDNKRPAAVTVHLLANDKDTGITAQATETGGWQWSFADQPVYSRGEKIVYTVAEEPVPEYTVAYARTADGAFTITNTHAPDKTQVNVFKLWADLDDADGMRPESVTVHLIADDVDTGQTLTLSAQNYWMGTFSNLDKNKGGKEIAYTVTEDAVDGYTTQIESFAGEGEFANTFFITNDRDNDKVTIEGTKVWADDNDRDGLRPESVTVRLLREGTEIGHREVSDDDWSFSFGQLSKNWGGRAITYTVIEDPVPGYQTEVTGSVEDGFTVTNTHEPQKTQVTVRKVWDDAGNQDGKRPESVTVRLMADGADTDQTLTLSKTSDWQGTFADLNKNNNGKEIVYTVEETEVEGYAPEYVRGYGGHKNEFTIINAHEPEQVVIDGTKAWVDDSNRDGMRPQSVVVRLRAKVGDDEEAEVDQREVSAQTATEDGDWTWSFGERPKYKDGQEIAYSVVEDAVAGYTTQIPNPVTTAATTAQSEQRSFTITNTHLIERATLVVGKTWDDVLNQDGIRPQSVTVHLTANGSRTGDSRVLDEGNGWATYVGGLPKNAGGRPITYGLAEDPIPWGYTPNLHTYDVTAGTILVVENTHKTAEVSIEGAKVWDDDNDRDGIRPQSVTVWLLMNGYRVASKEVTAKDDWQWSFDGFPLNQSGQKVTYTVEEEPVDGYTTAVSGNAEDGFTITNTHEPKKLELVSLVMWDDWQNNDGSRPTALTAQLLANGTRVGQAITLSEDNDWFGSFGTFNLYEEGMPIHYALQTVSVGGYDTSTSVAEDTNEDGILREGFIVYCAHDPQFLTIAGQKTWDDDDDRDRMRPQSITVQLCNEAGSALAQQEVSAANDWKWSFDEWTRYLNGKEVAYQIREVSVDGYEAEVSGGEMTGGSGGGFYQLFSLKNTHAPQKTQVSVAKVWDDANDQDGLRPESVQVRLLADGKDTGSVLVLSEDNQWTGVFQNLNKNEAGKPIAYTVAEDAVPDYEEPTISGDATGGFTITNKHTPKTVSSTVRKIWDDEDDKDGIRPGKLTVSLTGGSTTTDVVLSAKNDWTATVDELPAYDHGEEIEYAWSEKTAPEGYELVDTVTKGTTTTLTNRHVPQTATYAITYDLNGGSYDGSTANIVEHYPAGTVIKIHAAPTREGHTFTYWKGSKYKPGDSYTVEGDHTFVAQWKSSKTPTPKTPKTPTSGTPTPPASRIPVTSVSRTATPGTGDSLCPPELWLASGCLGLVLVAMAQKLRRRYHA